MIRRPPRSPLFPYTPLSRSNDPETTGRTTAANYVLNTIGEVEQFLNRLAALDAAKGKPTPPGGGSKPNPSERSEEHTSELQSQSNLVCRLLLEKKKVTDNI